MRLTIHEINVLTENSSGLKQLDEDIVIIDGKHSLKGVEITVNVNEKKKFQSASQQFVTKLRKILRLGSLQRVCHLQLLLKCLH